MIAEDKSTDPTVCRDCGKKLVYLWGEDYWACMNLAHGKLISGGELPKKQAVVMRSGKVVGEAIRRGLKKMGKPEPLVERDPEYLRRYLELCDKLDGTGILPPVYEVWLSRVKAAEEEP